MRRLRILTTSLALIALGAMPVAAAGAGAAVPHLGTPEVITSLGGEANLMASSSVPGHGDAYAVFWSTIGRNVYSVVYRDAGGHAHRFELPTRRGTYPQAVRIVALEDGAGMAIWDDGSSHSILARAWTRDGRLGATHVVLAGVTTTHSSENDGPQWRVRADGRGTVVVVTSGRPPDDMGRVYAAVRDPGATFGAQQELTRPPQPQIYQRQLRVSPIAADGSVAVAWGPEYGEGPGGGAIRTGRAARFGAPVEQHYGAGDPLLTQTNHTVRADDGTPITISVRLARLCPCIRPQVFRWGGGTRVLAFQTYGSAHAYELGNWYVATSDRTGAFTDPRLATRNASSLPVRRATPGEVGFARFDTNTDYNLFRPRSRLVVVPFGPKVARSRRAPRIGFGTYANASSLRLLVPVHCDRVCTVRGSSGTRRLGVTNSQGRRVTARLEPFTIGYLRLPLRRGLRSTTVRFTATDDAGHASTAQTTFLRGRRAGLWCIAGSRTCR